MKKLYDVAVVGEIFTDHIFSGFAAWPPAGVEVFTEQYAREVGGGAANTAAALARLGKRAALLGVVGASEKRQLQRRLGEFGVLLDELRAVQTATGVTVSISTKQERTFFTYPGANSFLPEYLRSTDALAHLSSARHVHFAMPLSRDIAAALLPELKKANCSLSIDVGWQVAWLTDKENLATCKACDFFLPNEKEGAIFTGADTPSDILESCAEAGIPGTVLKLGERGAAMAVDRRIFMQRPFEVEAVDTTGAGDAFNAGLIDGLLDGLSAEEMVRRACMCGALSTRAMGALAGLPTRGDLKEFYEQA